MSHLPGESGLGLDLNMPCITEVTGKDASALCLCPEDQWVPMKNMACTVNCLMHHTALSRYAKPAFRCASHSYADSTLRPVHHWSVVILSC